MRIYVASSWRNDRQPSVVAELRAAGHDVYDFKNPPGGAGFGWEQVGRYDGDGLVDAEEFRGRMLAHHRAVEGFHSDFDAMRSADACVLVLPCNRSAHLELGWFVGNGRRSAVLLDGPRVTPELMYAMVDLLAVSTSEVVEWSLR